MHDPRFLYENLDEVRDRLEGRGAEVDWDRLVELFQGRLSAIGEFEESRHRQKQLSNEFKKIARDREKAGAMREELKSLSARVKELEHTVATVEEELGSFVMYIPNLPDESVPEGTSEEDNIVVRSWGEPRTFDFEALPHWDVGTAAGVLDLEAAAKVGGSRQALYRGAGVYLELGLARFMLDEAAKRGYEPVLPPYMVTRQSMEGTGQLPKFAEEAFSTDDMFLIPTAEVPVTNMHREEILQEEQLPIKYAAYSSCFRREAGAAGQDTRGITRVHQFQKVELVKFTTPESSPDELEALAADAEAVLQLLELPYRVSLLCRGDMGFSAGKCYDLEVWLPGQKTYREISSCSNFYEFQARRASIRYRPEGEKKQRPRFVHTINGSGLAIGRTIIAILENYQQADGSVVVPKVLVPYMGGLEVIKPQ